MDARRHFRVDWRQLSVSYPRTGYLPKLKRALLTSKHEPKGQSSILKSLDGHFRSGEISAILGPSGAGKSTFLAAVFDSKHEFAHGRTQVSWFADKAHKVPIKADDANHERPMRVTFLPQQDKLLDRLTVYETLMFASKLKNAARDPQQDSDAMFEDVGGGAVANNKQDYHLRNVLFVAKMLKITECLNTKCGSLSGGQYKRVSIAQELMSKPDIIIMDEPTTGLDASTCLHIIRNLKSIARKQEIAIIMTIHQPDAETFELFDHVYCIAQGGFALYEGSPRGVVARLASCGLQVGNDSASMNPAALLLRLAFKPEDIEHQQGDDYEHDHAVFAMHTREDLVKIRRKLNRIQEEAYNSKKCIDQSHEGGISVHDTYSTQYESRCFDSRLDRLQATPMLKLDSKTVREQARILAHRSWLTIWRNRNMILMQLFFHVSLPLGVSILLPVDEQQPGGGEPDKALLCPRLGPLDLVEFAYMEPNVTEFVREPIERLSMAIERIKTVHAYFFFACTVTALATSISIVDEFKVVAKETKNHAGYSMLSYCIGKTLADLPVPLVMNTMGSCILIYFLDHGHTLGETLLIIVMLNVCSFIAQSWALILGIIFSRSVSTAIAANMFLFMTFQSLSGTFVRTRFLVWVASLILRVSHDYYMMATYLIITYGLGKCPCTQDDLIGAQTNNSDHKLDGKITSVTLDWLADQPDYANKTRVNNETSLFERLTEATQERASSGGYMDSCDTYKSRIMSEFDVDDYQIYDFYFITIILLLALRFCASLVMTIKVFKSH